MRVGYEIELLDYVVEANSIEDAARSFADEFHTIEDCGDTEFDVYVEDNEGKIHKVEMRTDYDPIYFAYKSSEL